MNSKRTLGALAVAYGLGALGWILDWRSHLAIASDPAAAGTMNRAHTMLYLGALLAVLTLALALNATLSRGGRVWLWSTGAGCVLILAGPPLLMMGAGIRAAWLMGYMTATGMIAGVVPLLIWVLAILWLCVRRGWIRGAGGAGLGIAVVLIGLAIDLGWHRANPAANEMAMNVILLPGHQVELVGFVLGLLASLVAVVRPAASSTSATHAAQG